MSLGWYGNAYVALIFLSPILNAGLVELESRGRRVLLDAWLAYACLMMIAWLPVEGFGVLIIPGGFDNMSANTILFYYVTGRVAAKFLTERDIGRGWLLLAFVGALACVVAWGYLVHVFKDYALVDSARRCRGYASPFAVVSAISLFLLFRKITLPRLVSRLVSLIAPSMFMVYLLHDGCSGAPCIAWYSNVQSHLLQWGVGNFASVLICASMVFVVCVLIDLVRRGVLKLFKSWYYG